VWKRSCFGSSFLAGDRVLDRLTQILVDPRHGVAIGQDLKEGFGMHFQLDATTAAGSWYGARRPHRRQLTLRWNIHMAMDADLNTVIAASDKVRYRSLAG
jgi:hypothetical protein